VASGPNPVARVLFLQAVARCVPQAVSALATLEGDDPEALRAWAIRWGFTDDRNRNDWMLRHARNHVQLWRDHPDLVGRWWMFPMMMRWEPIVPAAPSWHYLNGESKTAYLKRQRAYLDTLERMPGIGPMPEKETMVSFEWLALHHVGRWRYEQIAREYGNSKGYPDVPAISRAITDTASLIGLTLRPTRGRKLSPAS
jgi:hypothetical protein